MRLRAWRNRNSPVLTGFGMVALWSTIAYYTPFTGLKFALAFVALLKLLDTLEKLAEHDPEPPPHVGGGLTSSAAIGHEHDELAVAH